MKNNYFILSIVYLFTLISCGTSSKLSHNENNKFQNGIYYTPSANEQYASNQNKQELKELQNKTQNSFYNRGTNTETIYLDGDQNIVDIDYNPNVNYSIVDNDESYESRLKKFDSPTYTININTNYAWGGNPWWSSSWYWNSPWYWGNRWWVILIQFSTDVSAYSSCWHYMMTQ